MREQKFTWTDHAQKRLHERRIPEKFIVSLFTSPDRKIRKDNGAVEFQKKIDERTVTAIVKQNNHGENIIISCWLNPPMPGTKDFRKRIRYNQIRSASGIKKLWFIFLQRTGL